MVPQLIMRRMRRVKFSGKGMQRKFIGRALKRINCPSLRSIRQFGFDIPYSTLKNYFTEKRLLPEDFFMDLCYLAKIDINSLKVSYMESNWGQVKGGKKRKGGKR